VLLRRSLALAVTGVALAAPSGALAGAGDLDPTFSSDGKLTTSFGGTPFHADDTGNAAARDGTGRIYIAGSTPANEGDFAVARLTSAGVVDTTFGNNGIVATDISGSDSLDQAWAVLIDGSGNVVVAGTTGTDEEADFAVARYTNSGVPDASFGGGDGVVVTDLAGRDDEAFGATLAGTNIIVAGLTDTDPDTSNESNDFAIASYNSTGALDPSFGGGDGLVTTDFSSGRDEAFAVRATGSTFVAAGRTDPAGADGGDFALARYSASTGAPDNTFDTDGKQTLSFTSVSNSDFVSALAGDGSDRIIAVGATGGSDCGIARLASSNGAPDNTFDSDGKQVVSTPASGETLGSADQCYATAVQADDAVVVAGAEFTNGDRWVLGRVTSTGAIDSAFGTNGIVITDFGSHDLATGLFVDESAGKIIAAGTGNDNFAAARYAKSDGALDTTFGTAGSGRVEVDVVAPTPSTEAAGDVALQPDGKAVVVGSTNAGPITQFGGDGNFALARYNGDGTLDSEFGAGGLDGNGRLTTNFDENLDTSGTHDGAAAVALQSDGKIVVAGSTDPVGADPRDFAIARYLSNGNLDPGFGGGDGLVTTNFGGGTGGSGGDYANDVAIEGTPGTSSFRIVAAGATSGNNLAEEDFAVAAYKEDGTPDDSFDGDGKQTTSVGFGDIANGVAIQADGKIVAGGQSGAFSATDFAMVRYGANGIPDSDFGGGDGIVTTAFNGFDLAEDVAVQELGEGEVRIVLVGRADAGSGTDGAMAAYTTDGTLDDGFNGNGKLPVPLGGSFPHLTGVALQPDGKIVASGVVEAEGFGVVRVTSTGSLDPTFGGDGRTSTPFAGSASVQGANGLAPLPDGRVLAVGGDQPPQNGSDFMLARFGDAPVTTPPQTQTQQPTVSQPVKKKCKKKKRAASAAKKKCKKKKKKH
jgi:uncharacterized delta-60 repeat protein